MQAVVTWNWMGMERSGWNLEIFRMYLWRVGGRAGQGSRLIVRILVNGGDHNRERKRKRKGRFEGDKERCMLSSVLEVLTLRCWLRC